VSGSAGRVGGNRGVLATGFDVSRRGGIRLCEAVSVRPETPDARVFAGVLATGFVRRYGRPSPLAAVGKNGHGAGPSAFLPFQHP